MTNLRRTPSLLSSHKMSKVLFAAVAVAAVSGAQVRSQLLCKPGLSLLVSDTGLPLRLLGNGRTPPQLLGTALCGLFSRFCELVYWRVALKRLLYFHALSPGWNALVLTQPAVARRRPSPSRSGPPSTARTTPARCVLDAFWDEASSLTLLPVFRRLPSARASSCPTPSMWRSTTPRPPRTRFARRPALCFLSLWPEVATSPPRPAETG